MNDRKRATAAFIDIDALLQDTATGDQSASRPDIPDGKGVRFGSAALMMSGVCSEN